MRDFTRKRKFHSHFSSSLFRVTAPDKGNRQNGFMHLKSPAFRKILLINHIFAYSLGKLRSHLHERLIKKKETFSFTTHHTFINAIDSVNSSNMLTQSALSANKMTRFIANLVQSGNNYNFETLSRQASSARNYVIKHAEKSMKPIIFRFCHSLTLSRKKNVYTNNKITLTIDFFWKFSMAISDDKWFDLCRKKIKWCNCDSVRFGVRFTMKLPWIE